jgi:hypothetical protein
MTAVIMTKYKGVSNVGPDKMPVILSNRECAFLLIEKHDGFGVKNITT